MSRFKTATAAVGALMAAAGFLAPGPWRWWLWGIMGGIYLALVGLGATFSSWNFFGPAVCRGRPGARRVSLTFDDGPDPATTPRLLEILEKHGVQAAFFLIGENAARHRQLTESLAAKGHLVGNHTYRHAWWTNFLWGKRLEREIQAAQQVLTEILGQAPRFFRSPMGLTNPHLFVVLRRAGLRLVGWDVRGLDQRAVTAGPVVRRLLNGCRDGSIILLHDGGSKPRVLADIVNNIIPALRNRGFILVRLDELLESSAKEG
jgi:peptidoglycan-N-acetylglucosamine deacetylase